MVATIATMGASQPTIGKVRMSERGSAVREHSATVKLQLAGVVPARPQEADEAIVADQMTHSHDDQGVLPALNEANELRDPAQVAVAKDLAALLRFLVSGETG